MNPAPSKRDRRQLLLSPGSPGHALNGIDYVEVAPEQTRLFVHFLNVVPVESGLSGGAPVTISGGEVITTVTVNQNAISWSADEEGRPVMAVTVAAPGDFSTYRLTILSPSLDPFFDSASFTFKANCPTTVDCAAAAPVPKPEAPEQVSIDYLAKDFASFKQALSEFSAVRYPGWVERSEADVGVMLMEALAAVADELSYYQDRVWAESTIQTATQRLSVIRHARLVDYEPAPATVATTTLQLDVSSVAALKPPLVFRALGADGSLIDFEFEDPLKGLAGSGDDTAPGWEVDPRWNRGNLAPYYWDDTARSLAAGSTVFYLQGVQFGLTSGQQLLLDSPATNRADPNVRELVTVSSSVQTSDPLFGVALTKVSLAAPTTLDHDLSTTVVAGNIVPVVQGLSHTDIFTIPDPAAPPGPVVVRAGANSTPDYRYCLAAGPLAWLATDDQDKDTAIRARPEIRLTVLKADGTEQKEPWAFSRWLINADNTQETGKVFTLTPEQYSPVLAGNGITWNGVSWKDATWFDYDGDGGTTIRFGDGTFGLSPQPETTFKAVYRVGGGPVGNVPADAIVTVAPGQAQGSFITSCTNPLPAKGGTDAETIAQVRSHAPAQFRAEPLRVVQAADYAAAVQSDPRVQQAGTRFRWSGSWLTVFTTANPAGSEEPTVELLTSLTQLLDRRRLAGYESYLLPPSYVSVDLQITVCGQPSAFASDVQTAVLARLQPGPLPGGAVGFFDHSQWSFGKALESSALLAAIQSCPGVIGVYQVQYRERGVQLDWAPLPGTLTFGPDQILRVDNDPSRPEAGSLRVAVEGSK